MFLADWTEMVFIHYAVDPFVLRRAVPPDLKIDLYDGRAYVSLVAFTQRRLRFWRGGRFAALLTAPLATHEFLNLRTYVHADGQRAIFFLSEWIPNRLAVLIGPRAYGLPYRLARVKYRDDFDRASVAGHVSTALGREFRFRGRYERMCPAVAAEPKTLAYFLLERYAAFTFRNGILRRFEIDHEPWPQTPLEVQIIDTSLLRQLELPIDWHHPSSTNLSLGVFDVGISRPYNMARCRWKCSTTKSACSH